MREPVDNEVLRENERQFRSLAATLPDNLKEFILDQAREAVYLIDNDHGYRFLYVNEEACRSLGYRREELIGLTPRDIDPQMKPQDALRLRDETPEGFLTFETYHRRRDGSLFPVELQTSAIQFNGKRLSLVLARDITQRKQAEQLIEESRTQLRALFAQNERVREEERKHISREIHDELGQILTGLQLDLSILSIKFGANLPEMREHIQSMLGLVNKSLEVARNVATALRPASLDMGIVAAIEWLADRFTRSTGGHCEIHISEQDSDSYLEENLCIALFRITQESLTNVARHANASRVDISFSHEEGYYILEVRDNGKGIDLDNLRKGSCGLLGMRERVYLFGGELAIDGKPGSGTVIKVRLPAGNV